MRFRTFSFPTSVLTAVFVAGGICLTSTPAHADDLGQAQSFNFFIFGNATNTSDAQGRTAVGGNATYTNFPIGQQDYNVFGQLKDQLIVGGALSYTGGQIFGNAAATSAPTFTGTFPGSPQGPGGSLRTGSGNLPFNPASFLSSYQSRSTYYASLANSFGGGSITQSGGGNFITYNLTGTNAGLNVFNLSSSTLAANPGFVINVPATATALINITGNTTNNAGVGAGITFTNSNITFSGGGADKRTLFNLSSATQVNVSGYRIQGSLLAPNASVVGANGASQDGTLIASGVSGQFEGHIIDEGNNYTGTIGSGTIASTVLFQGSLPTVVTAAPEPGSVALLGVGFIGMVGMSARRKTRS